METAASQAYIHRFSLWCINDPARIAPILCLNNNEIKQSREYRIQRLVLEAWDRMFE